MPDATDATRRAASQERIADVIDLETERAARMAEALPPQPDLAVIQGAGEVAADNQVVIEDLPEETRLTRLDVAHILNIPLSTTKRLTDGILAQDQSLILEDSGDMIYLHEGVIDRVSAELPPPEEWQTAAEAAEAFGVKPDRLERLIGRLRKVSPGDFRPYKRRSDNEACLHFTPAVTAKLRDVIERTEKAKRDNPGTGGRTTEPTEIAIDDFNLFTDEVKSGETIEAHEFQQLLSLFGAERAMDLLFRYRPNYKRVPMPLVRSFLADYMGEFLVNRGPIDFEGLRETIDFLSNKNLKEGLTQVIKRHALSMYHHTRRSDPTSDEFNIIADYLADLRTKLGDIESKHLSDVLNNVEAYYYSVFFGTEIPTRIAEVINDERPFPDLNQRINIQELKDNKRLLIADDPGMGKSASAILSKEAMGLKCAVIVAPSDIIKQRVWQNYLSDTVRPDGTRIGYFKDGQEPRVLVVDSPRDLENITADDYDYIIISQERLNGRYADALMAIDYDMLVVDEAHKLDNIESGVRAGELMRLAEKLGDNYLLLLTATPAKNKVSDIAMALKLLYPDDPDIQGKTIKELTNSIIKGDVLEIRSKLLPRMQMKRLEESIDMPGLRHEIEWIELNESGRELYELLQEEDEMDFNEKMHAMRKFLLNPALLQVTPNIMGSKIDVVGARLAETFKTKDKAVMFVNGYIEDVIRGKSSILPQFGLPPEVRVMTIHGETPQDQRYAIQQYFQNQPGKMLLVVSGQTAEVGVDFSAADELMFYNEPWTDAEKRQQIGRAWRPGRNGELVSRTYITRGTVEEGIHRYLKAKSLALEKLYHGVPLSELEQELFRTEERVFANRDVNPELAAYYVSESRKLAAIFAGVKEIGEKRFRDKLKGEDTKGEPPIAKPYASSYEALGRRSYQANASRLSGAMIDAFAKEAGRAPAQVRILDIGSGPEMLRRHIKDDYADSITSIDINPEHFFQGTDKSKPGGYRHVASMLNLPVASGSIDYANLSLALHYTSYLPSKQVYERLEALTELNRVLKPGGRAFITMINSRRFRDDAAFRAVVEKLGFKVVEDYTGDANYEEHFKAQIITLEKTGPPPASTAGAVRAIGSDNIKGLKMEPSRTEIRYPRKIAERFWIEPVDRARHSKKQVNVSLNEADKQVVIEERTTIKEMETLRDRHRHISEIPAEDIINRGFARVFYNHGYVLFKSLSSSSGAVVLRQAQSSS